MSRARISLFISGHPQQEQFVSGTTTIGRDAANTICIPDSAVSRYHAKIDQRGDQFVVCDLHSNNGTCVNGKPIQTEYVLKDGDIILIADVATIDFSLDQQPVVWANPETAPEVASGGGGGSISVGSPTISAPYVNMPSVTGPSVTLPSVTGPSISGTSISGPHISTPSVSGPYISTPSVSAPSLSLSSTTMPVSGSWGSGTSLVYAAGALAGAIIVGTIAFLVLKAPHTAGSTPSQRPPTGSQIAAQGTTSTPVSPTGNSQTTSSVESPTSTGSDIWRAQAQTLAARVGGQTSYVFSDEFLAEVVKYHSTTSRELIPKLHGQLREIDVEFTNSGLPKFMGYVLALSLLETGGQIDNIWAIPATVVASEGYSGSNTRIAAQYLKNLRDAVFSPDDFMYALACYGMTAQEAGKFKSRLEEKDPNRTERRNFWKMKDRIQLQPSQTERVYRFFAAGAGKSPDDFKPIR